MLSILLVLIAFLVDTTASTYFFKISFVPSFMPLVLAYHVLHNRYIGLIFMALVASLLISTVSVQNPRYIIFLYILLFSFFFYVRQNVYVESYLSQAYWVVMMTALQHLFLRIGFQANLTDYKMWLGVVMSSFFAGMCSILIFMFWDPIRDVLYERIQGRVARLLIIGIAE